MLQFSFQYVTGEPQERFEKERDTISRFYSCILTLYSLILRLVLINLFVFGSHKTSDDSFNLTNSLCQIYEHFKYSVEFSILQERRCGNRNFILFCCHCRHSHCIYLHLRCHLGCCCCCHRHHHHPLSLLHSK